jgi:hypothetical protein
MMSRFSFLSLFSIPMAAELAAKPENQPVPKSEPAPQFPIPEVQWTGDDIATIAAARAIIHSQWWVLCEEDDYKKSQASRAEVMKFYNGDQWDADTRQDRLAKGRPCLTVNRLPSLVAASIEKELALFPASQIASGALTAEEIQDLCILVTRRNRSAQEFYNYMASSVAEIMAENVRASKLRITSGSV